jgi:hypothetical protein
MLATVSKSNHLVPNYSAGHADGQGHLDPGLALRM